jgi:tetratricopeptide (TPR) repeat protein
MTETLNQEITRLRKAGQLQEAWDIGCPAVQEKPNDAYLKGAFFWVCYAYLKQVQTAIKDRSAQNKGNDDPNPSEVERVNFLLDWIIWLKIPPGGFEYRSLLLLFQKNLEAFPRLVLLLARFSSDLFDKEQGDHEPYPGEKGESPSLMLKFARKTANSWMDHEEARQLSMDQLLQIFEQVRREALDKKNLIWLDYDEAKCLIIAGRLEQAREFILPVLRKKQAESWAWGALAATYRKQDPNVAITLLAEGLTHVNDEVFSLNLLKGIAPLLAAQGFEEQASMCAQRAVNCYQENGWAIKADLAKLIQEPWFSGDIDVGRLAPFLQERARGALAYLHGPTEQCVAVVMHIHKSGRGFHAYRDHEHRYSVRLGLYDSKSLPVPGAYIRLTLSAEDDPVVGAEPWSAEKMADVDFIEGNIRLTDKGFGFVDDTFVPPHLVREGMDGQVVKLMRILDFDKAKNRPGWKALTLEVVKPG